MLLPPELQQELAGYWTTALGHLSAPQLHYLLQGRLSLEEIASWLSLIANLPKAMLRPSQPAPEVWHARLAQACRDLGSLGHYALQFRVQHALKAGLWVEAALALSDFDHLQARVSLGPEQAQQIWQETLALQRLLSGSLLGQEIGHWQQFWRGHQFLLGDQQPEQVLLSLAQGYARSSPISAAANQWLEESPNRPDWWLALEHPPLHPDSKPWEIPLLGQPPLIELQLYARGTRALGLSGDGTIRIWDLQSGQSLGQIQGPLGSGFRLALDEDQLLSAQGQQAYLYDLRRQTLIRSFKLPSLPGGPLALSGPLICYQQCHDLTLVDLQGQLLNHLKGRPELGLQQWVAFDQGRAINALWSDGQVSRWLLDSAGQVLAHRANSRLPWGPRWAEGRLNIEAEDKLRLPGAPLDLPLSQVQEFCQSGPWALVSISGGPPLENTQEEVWQCWNLDDGDCLAQWVSVPREGSTGIFDPRQQQPGSRVRTCLSGDGSRVLSLDVDDNLRHWQADDGQLLGCLPLQASALASNRDGTRALTGDSRGRLMIWDLEQGLCLAVWEAHDQPIEHLAWAHNNWLISGDSLCFRLWDESLKLRAQLDRPGDLHFRQLSPCGRYALGYPTYPPSDDLRVRDLDQGQTLARLEECDDEEGTEFQICAGGQQVLCAGPSGTRLWEVGEAKPSQRLRCHSSLWASDGRRLIAADSTKLRLWDLSQKSAPGHSAPIDCHCLDATRLATAGQDHFLKIWDLESGQCLYQRHWPKLRVSKLRLYSHYLGLETLEGQAYLWDLPQNSLQPCSSLPLDVSSSGWAITRCSAQDLCLWHPRGPSQEPLVLQAPQEMLDLAFSPDGSRLAGLGEGGILWLWHCDDWELEGPWQLPLLEAQHLSWIEEPLLRIQGGPGEEFTWDLATAQGWRWQPPDSPWEVDCSSGLACFREVARGGSLRWPQAVTQVLPLGSGRFVALLTDGEVGFWQLLDRPCWPRDEPPEPTSTQAEHDSGGLAHSPLEHLARFDSLLLVGSGGEADLLAALPLYFWLRSQGKQVWLAGLNPPELPQYPCLSLSPGGPQERLQSLKEALRHSGAQALVLVEAGLDCLQQGDEPAFANPDPCLIQDLTSLWAAHQLPLAGKFLLSWGTGIDRPRGHCLAHSLKSIADLTASGGFLGSLSLLPGMPEHQAMLEVLKPLPPSAWSRALVNPDQEHLTPLFWQMWFFQLDAVASQCQVLSGLTQANTPQEISQALGQFLAGRPPRAWMDLPI